MGGWTEGEAAVGNADADAADALNEMVRRGKLHSFADECLRSICWALARRCYHSEKPQAGLKSIEKAALSGSRHTLGR